VTGGEWDGLVVICGGSRLEGMVSSAQQIAVRLAPSTPVLYVDPPVSHASVRRAGSSGTRERPRLRVIGERLARLTPLVQPGIDRNALSWMTELLTKRAMRKTVRSFRADVRAVVVESQRVLFGACNEARKIVYSTDDLVAGAELLGVDRRSLIRRQRRLANQADLVVCTTEEIAATWEVLGSRTALVPNGCTPEAYADLDSVPPAGDVELEPPIAGFLGNVSERIDVSLLEAVAATGTSLLIVGPRPNLASARRFDKLLHTANVQWVPERPRRAMPSYLRWIDVGLTPYADSAFNRASDPLKTLEYLAGGRRVVATGLPATRRLGTDLVTIADTVADFVTAVERELTRPLTNDEVQRRKSFAALHSWDKRAEAFRALLYN
jgi:teichuronic acid biosynthesis glycosyltransferase TuaH